MKLSDYDYQLPEHLIAQEPLRERQASRMMVVDRGAGSISDRMFAELPDLLVNRDVLVLNNTKVFPARLLGRSESGANVEIFLIREIGDLMWEALSRPARRLPPGKGVYFGDGLYGEIIERLADGKTVIRFQTENRFEDVLDRIGQTPLPPYIKRVDGTLEGDKTRYQTVYAKERGSIAAPTAGLHFTGDVIEKIKVKGVDVIEITLHVSYGTFEPVRADDISEHRVGPEGYQMDDLSAESLNRAIRERRRIIAVGTTTTRALESCVSKNGKFVAGRSTADLTITPGYKFKAVNALLTNFHLPKSSLLILVSTFAGRDLIMKAYEHAVDSAYRFYSYGDCMFII
jgi:S-adenosylmethionine:tRNA ribosyltransferase-isomerase